jgi:hypothetical protein
MLATIGFSVLLTLSAQSPAPSEPLVELGLRLKLRSTAGEIAKTGRRDLVERMTAVLAGLGDPAKDLERLAGTWEKSAASAKPTRSTRTTAAGKLERDVDSLAGRLADTQEPRRSELARWILELDSAQPAASAVIGRERDADGEWLTTEERAWKAGARRGAELLGLARTLEFEIEHGASDNPALVRIAGAGRFARGHGIELHARFGPEKLERILRQALRAMALSNGLFSGHLELHPGLRPRKFVLLDRDELMGPALDEAQEAGGLEPGNHEDLGGNELRSFYDSRGWRTARWRPEAELEALIVWDVIRNWLEDAQPCLSAGHLNWVCLSFLGSSMPTAVWRDEAGSGPENDAPSVDESWQRQPLWRCARQSPFGCRAWMIRAKREKRDPPWTLAMVDQEGRIQDENLLKTTLACELLQQEGRLWEVIESTRDKRPPAAAIEKAVGEPWNEFERRWRRWLDPAGRTGVLQELARGTAGPGEEDSLARALRTLDQAREQALKDRSPELAAVSLDPELCRAAELHARYLALNPAQKARWPGELLELASAPGFSSAGAHSGARALIAYEGDASRAVEGWLGTFYHRLPLLEPGLFGIGIGMKEDVVVLDAHSLAFTPEKDRVVVWPPPGAQGVRRSFVPEFPSPVPGADMMALGYPITVQLYFLDTSGPTALELQLSTADKPERVDCHVITPDAPLQTELVPENVWGLIPKQPLRKRTRYTAQATWADQVEVWSFTTGD